MVQKAEVLGVVLQVVGIALGVVCLALERWYVYEDTSNNYTIYAGVKTWSSEYVASTTTKRSGKLEDSSCPLGKERCKQLDEAGTWALGWGVPGTFLCVVSFVLFLMSFAGKPQCGPGKGRVTAILLLLTSIVFYVVGFVSYARGLYVGYAFILFIVCCFLFLAAATLLAAGFAAGTKAKQIVGVVSLILGFGLVITAMATYGWVVFTGESTDGSTFWFGNGLRRWAIEVTTKTGIVVKDGGPLLESKDSYDPMLRTGLPQKIYDGGTAVMATGSIALASALGAFTLFVVSSRGHPSGSLKVMAVILLLVSAGLVLLGITLFAQKLSVGMSFIGFIASTFILLVAAAAMASTGLGSAGNRETSTTVTSTRAASVSNAAKSQPLAKASDISFEPAGVDQV